MIKLNHKHPLVKELFDRTMDNCELEVLNKMQIEEKENELLLSLNVKGYRFEFSQSKETFEYTLLAVWQLDECENPIFEV